MARAWRWLRANVPPTLSRWARFVVANFNTLVVKLPSAIVVIFIIAIVVRGLTGHVTVIEPLSVPKELEDRGYTPEVAGKHLRDAVDRFATAVNTTMKSPEIALQGELPNIVVPTVGISLDAIVASMRTLLRSTRSRSVAGELTILGDQLWLRLRLDGREIYSSPPGDVNKPDDLMAAAASEVLKNIQPYFAAVAMRNNNPTGAMALANAVIEHRPESDENVAWLYNLKGSIFYYSGDFLAARSAAEKALALNPALTGAHLNLGLFYAAEGDRQSAMSEDVVAAKIDPHVAVTRNNLAVGLQFRGDSDRAIEEYEATIKLEANYALAHRNFGDVPRSLNRDREAASEYDEAIAQYRRLIESNPKDIVAHLDLGYALRARGDTAGATAEFMTAIAKYTEVARNEPNIVARRMLGDALVATERYDEAAAAYQEGIDLVPNAVGLHYKKGEALRSAKKFDDAAVKFRLAIKAEPKYAQAHNTLAIALSEMGKTDEALREFQAAVAIDPRYPSYHHNLGLELQKTGNREAAIAEYRRAIEANPRYALGHLMLARARRRRQQGRSHRGIPQGHRFRPARRRRP